MRETDGEVPRRLSYEGVSDDILARAMASENGEDDAAWREFYHRYKDRLMRFIKLMVGSQGQHECEDVFSETVAEKLLPALSRFHATESSSPLLAFACKIAQNVVIDRSRRQKSLPDIDDFVSVEDVAESLQLSSAEGGPSNAIVLLAQDALDRAFNTLVARDQALILFQRAGFTDREIGQKLGMAERLVSQARYKALRRLEGRLRREKEATALNTATKRLTRKPQQRL